MPNVLKYAAKQRAAGNAGNPVTIYKCPVGRTAIVKSAIAANTGDAKSPASATLCTKRGSTVTQLTGGISILSSASVNLLAGTLTLEAGDELCAYTSGTDQAMLTLTSGVPATVTSVSHDSGTIIATVSGGVFRSTDSGNTWTNVYIGTVGPVIAKINSDWFIYSDATTAIRSTDDGQTWVSQAVTNAPTWSNHSINGGVLKNGSTYAGLTSGTPRLTTSSDGITWTLATAFPTTVNSLTVSGGYYIAGTNTTALYRSPDGITWSTITLSGADTGRTAGLSSNGTGVVILSRSGSVSRSGDHGATWTSYTAAITGITFWTGEVFVGVTSVGYTVSPTGLPLSWRNSTDSTKNNTDTNWIVLDSGPVYFKNTDKASAENKACPFTSGLSVTASVMEVF